MPNTTTRPRCPDDGQLTYRTRWGARREARELSRRPAVVPGRYVPVRCPVLRHWHVTYTAGADGTIDLEDGEADVVRRYLPPTNPPSNRSNPHG